MDSRSMPELVVGLIQSVGVPIAILDTNFAFLAVNRAFEADFGYSARDLIGRPHLDIVDPSVRAYIGKRQVILRMQESPRGIERLVVQTRLGEAREAQVSIGATKIGTDTVFALTYRHLERPVPGVPFSSAEMYRLTIEESPLPISIQNRDYKIVMVNRAYCDLTGYSESELIGHDPADVLHPPELRPQLSDQRQYFLDAYHDNDANLVFVREMVARDGRRIQYRGELGRARGLDGEPLFVATIMDLSTLEEAKSRLDQHVKLSRSAQARFDTFASLSTDAIIVTDAHTGEVLQANPATESIFGIAGSAIVGQPGSNLGHHAAAADRQVLCDLLRHENPVDEPEAIVRIDHPAGSRLSVRVRIVDTGYIRERFVLAEDVTSRLERDSQRRRAEQRQREALIHEVHHRIKNGLHSVSALLERGRLQRHHSSQVLAAAVARVEAIAQVHGLLIDSPRQVPVRDLADAVFSSVEATYDVSMAVEHSSYTDIRWMVTEQESVPIALVLNELSTNAVKYGYGNEPVNLSVISMESGVDIRISNTGELRNLSEHDTRGAGSSGLSLVYALLPSSHAELSITQQGRQVVAHLRLTPPIITADDRAISAAA